MFIYSGGNDRSSLRSSRVSEHRTTAKISDEIRDDSGGGEHKKLRSFEACAGGGGTQHSVRGRSEGVISIKIVVGRQLLFTGETTESTCPK